jgi:hypothetical protein
MVLKYLILFTLNFNDVGIHCFADLALALSKYVVFLEHTQPLHFAFGLQPILETFQVNVAACTLALADANDRILFRMSIL